MRKTRAALSLALAVCAAIVLAAPATASAAEWTENGEPLAQSADLDLSGSFVAAMSGLGGVVCAVDGTLSLEPGDEGSVTEFSFRESEEWGGTYECYGVGGYSSCLVVNAQATNLPWHTQITNAVTGTVSSDDFAVKIDFEGCAVQSLQDTGRLEMQVDNASGISQFSYHVSGATMPTYGDLAASPAGVYGIQ